MLFRGCLLGIIRVTTLIKVINWRVRHGKKNICRGFHLLFPFSSSPISKAIMSEDERGKHWGIYIIYSSYICIKMDLVQPTIRNLLKQSPTRGTTLPRAKKTNLKMRSESLRTTTSLPGKKQNGLFPNYEQLSVLSFKFLPIDSRNWSSPIVKASLKKLPQEFFWENGFEIFVMAHS